MKKKDMNYLRRILPKASEMVEKLGQISEDMQHAFDNRRSDKWKRSEAGEKMREEISDFDTMLGEAERFKNCLENLVSRDEDD